VARDLAGYELKTAAGRLDSLEPDAFKYVITASELNS